MRQYDNIYVPEERKIPGDRVVGIFDPNYATFAQENQVREEESVIVLTLEELREVWEAGRRSKHFENNPKALYTDFNDYVAHKGINPSK